MGSPFVFFIMRIYAFIRSTLLWKSTDPYIIVTIEISSTRSDIKSPEIIFIKSVL